MTKPFRAFLSHSSRDKELVEAVAKDLGRQFCIFDKFCFETGDEFIEAIKKGLDESTVFVLFASSNSVKSFWVQLETDEAAYRAIQHNISPHHIHDDWLKTCMRAEVESVGLRFRTQGRRRPPGAAGSEEEELGGDYGELDG
jgi:TIR domain